jgi:hypothetical protein
MWIGFIWLGYIPEAECCEQGVESWDSIICGEFLD